jgi:tetratricopeptide (TPR) repeat protein
VHAHLKEINAVGGIAMPQEELIFRAARQQLLWPSLHAAIDVYQRRRASSAEPYELIWRLIHICECSAMTLAAGAITRIRELGNAPADYLKLRERCYGVSWNSTEGTLEKTSQGALDGSVDKWIEILQLVATFDVGNSKFLNSLKTFLIGPENTPEKHYIDLAPFVRAWGHACDVPPSVSHSPVSVKEIFQALNSFRNRFAHVPFPYDRLQDIYHELKVCVFRIFEIPPTAANDESPLSGYLGLKESVFRGAGFCKTLDSWPNPKCETFAWGKQKDIETWHAQPFIFLDKMTRPYLLSRLKNEEAGSWEYIRFLAEANAVHSLPNLDLLKLLPRPSESDYLEHKDDANHPVTANHQEAPVEQPDISPNEAQVVTRSEAIYAIKERRFEPAIEFFKREIKQKEDEGYNYHSGWQRLGFAQREFGVYLMAEDRKRAEQFLRQSLQSYTKATNHTEQRFAAEAYYHRSKSHWRLGMLTLNEQQTRDALQDAEEAATRFYDHRFISWLEFLKESGPRISVPAVQEVVAH